MPNLNIENLVGKLPRNPNRKPDTRTHKDIAYLAVHHVGPNGDHTTPEAIAKYHVGPNHISKTGCPTICYAYGVTRLGHIYKLENMTTITWNVNALYNKRALGILLFDDLDLNHPTDLELGSLRDLVLYEIMPILPWITPARVLGHREFKLVHKTCPGKNMDMAAFRANLPARES